MNFKPSKTRKIIVNTTFREFAGNQNDAMQINFLKSLKQQTVQDFILVVSIFEEKNVAKIVKSILKDQCVFFYHEKQSNYKFSLSITFKNGVDYGLETNSDILLDCSSDIILQNNFLETVIKRCSENAAGISHPNVFVERKNNKYTYKYGEIGRGIDARFFSLELFKRKELYHLLEKYPSYNYGAGIEVFLCSIPIKYADKRCNIFMESKVFKTENDRGGVNSGVNSFMREGYARNIPVVRQFLVNEEIGLKYFDLVHINRKYIITKYRVIYRLIFLRQYFQNFL